MGPVSSVIVIGASFAGLFAAAAAAQSGLSDPTVVLVHGSWHAAWCWARVQSELTAAGRLNVAVDMLGSGLSARRPAAALARAFDSEAFAREPSPLAEVTLGATADDLVRQLVMLGRGEPVIVVAYSTAGTVLSRVVRQAPHLVTHAVYLSAWLTGSGIPSIAYAQLPENEGVVLPLLRGDPEQLGALRLDTGSPDPAYREQLRHAFYTDLPAMDVAAWTALLEPDTPLALFTDATELTQDAFGVTPRTYIHTTQNCAIRPATQQRMVSEIDAAFPNKRTSTVELDSGHSSFFSVPAQLAEVLNTIR